MRGTPVCRCRLQGSAGLCLALGMWVAGPARLGSVVPGRWQGSPAVCFGDLRSPAPAFPTLPHHPVPSVL